MGEFLRYNMDDVYSVLKIFGIDWDGMMRDYIATENGNLIYDESEGTTDMLKTGCLPIADKRFGFLHVTPYSYTFNYCGHNYDASDKWTELLSQKYDNYLPYSKEYLEERLSVLAEKLLKQKDDNGMVASIIKEQMNEARENLERLDRLNIKEMGEDK